MTFVIEIASTSDRKNLVAEIWWNDQMVAEVRRAQDGSRYIDIYPSPARVPWSFKLEEWTRAVEEAKQR